MTDHLRAELGYHEKRDLPSRYWEPQPDEEERRELEEEACGDYDDDEELPFN